MLSAIAGYVDATGFMLLFGLLPAHITGELVGEAVALSSAERLPTSHRIWMLPVFVLSVALAALVARLNRRAGRAPLAALLLLIALALCAFCASGVALRALPMADPRSLQLLSGVCVVAAMGFQNTLMRESLNRSAPTTFMTGNLTQFVIELVERALPRVSGGGAQAELENAASKNRLKTTGAALSAFLASAVLGASLSRSVGALSALLPTALVGFMSWQAFREQRSSAANVLNAISAVNALRAAHATNLGSDANVLHAASELGRSSASAPATRYPTPIHRSLEKLPRTHSGTRIKAVRPVGASGDSVAPGPIRDSVRPPGSIRDSVRPAAGARGSVRPAAGARESVRPTRSGRG